MTEVTKYYEVCCKCGHVGRNNYIPISFPIIASSGKEAASIARLLPRVKHDKKDAIQYCNQIDYERYIDILEDNNNNPYLKCSSSKDQKQYPEIQSKIVFKEKTKRQHHSKEVVEYRIRKEQVKINECKLLLKEYYDGFYDYDNEF